MDIFNLDFKDNFPDIKEALLEICGEEYRTLFDARLQNVNIVYYYTLVSVSSYYDYLVNIKRKELILKFFKKINLDVGDYDSGNLGKEFEGNIWYYIDVFFGAFASVFSPINKDNCIGLKSFMEIPNNITIDVEELLMEQKFFVDYLTDKKIPYKSFKEFKKTNEFKKLLELINQYIEIYNELQEEFNQHLSTISHYKDFIDKERKRQDEHLNNQKALLYGLISDKIPESIKDFIDSRYPDPIKSNMNDGLDSIYNESLEKINNGKKAELFFGTSSLLSPFNIEYFSSKNEEILKDPNSSFLVKGSIYRYRLKYLHQFGFDFNPQSRVEDQYECAMDDEVIKKFIPTFEFVDEFIKIKEKHIDDAGKGFILSSDYFKKNIKGLSFNQMNTVASAIKDNLICITGGISRFDDFKTWLFFSACSGGEVDYAFIHEFIHAMEALFASGVEGTVLDLFKDEANPYRDNKRKYERFNELLTDILAIEVRNILFKKGIYFADSKEYTKEDVSDSNTDGILKKMINPLFTKLRKEFIYAKFRGGREYFYELIGYDNFEELIDIINKVDYLIDKNLKSKLDNGIEDHPLVIEFNEQMDRLNKLYENIDKVLESSNKEYSESHYKI